MCDLRDYPLIVREGPLIAREGRAGYEQNLRSGAIHVGSAVFGVESPSIRPSVLREIVSAVKGPVPAPVV